MTETKLTKALYTDITKLKLCSKHDALVRFLLDKSPFDIDDAKSNENIIIGRILPESDIYKEGAYQIEIKLTANFPIDPPEVRFLTPIYHPNVGKDGKILNMIFLLIHIGFLGKFCHDILKKTAKWKADNSLVDVIKAIVEHIDHPDIDYSLSPG
jgi:ubiquitin-protein ligase